jgi:hypothetical protein
MSLEMAAQRCRINVVVAFRMMGKLLVKLFWWLLSRGWLPDFLLRKSIVKPRVFFSIF